MGSRGPARDRGRSPSCTDGAMRPIGMIGMIGDVPLQPATIKPLKLPQELPVEA